jgi:stage III sporulation protein SpoIIIAA
MERQPIANVILAYKPEVIIADEIGNLLTNSANQLQPECQRQLSSTARQTYRAFSRNRTGMPCFFKL